jgi:hypothetical protein
MRTSSLCIEAAYGRFLEVSRTFILFVLAYSSGSHASPHRTPRLPGAYHPSTQDHLPISSSRVSYNARPSISAPIEWYGVLRVPSAYDVAQRNAITTSCSCRTAGTRGSEASVFLLPAGHGVATTSACCACCVTLDAVARSPNPISFTSACQHQHSQAHLNTPCFARHMSSRFCRGWRVTILLIGAYRDLCNMQTDLSRPRQHIQHQEHW